MGDGEAVLQVPAAAYQEAGGRARRLPGRHPTALQRRSAAIRRLDRAFPGFFRRVKAGEEPGYPQFKGRGWWDSIEWPENGGARWDSVPHPTVTRVHLKGIGHVRVHQHRAVKTQTAPPSMRQYLPIHNVCQHPVGVKHFHHPVVGDISLA
jgi:hypothetical protein